MPFSRVEVDTAERFADAVREIKRFAQSGRGPFSFDAEGIDLGRNGALTVMMLKPIDFTKDASQFPAYVIDITALGGDFVFNELRQVLESHIVQKIMFDCRSDADALLHQYQVKLSNVLDLQVFDQATRQPRERKGPLAYVPGMGLVAQDHVSAETVQELRGGMVPPHKEDMMIWGRRPLPEQAWQYSAADVHTIDLIYRSMLTKQVPVHTMQRVLFHSTRCLNSFRNHPQPVVFNAKFKHLILVEIPLEQDE